MFDNMTLKQKRILSWLVLVLFIIWLSFFSYYFFTNKALNFHLGKCLDEFKGSYENHSFIYEYDLSCKELFVNKLNLNYCDNYKDKDFCFYSFANFIDDKSARVDLCSKILDSNLKKNCM